MRGLSGKVGIVAGGGRGIGAATARRLASEGVSIVIGDIHEEWAADVADSINRAGGQALGLYLDITREDSVQAMVDEAVNRFGGLDFIHANAAGGTVGDTDALDMDLGVFDRSIGINLRSHLLCTRAALPHLLRRGGGAIIYTSSGSAYGGAPVQPSYAIAKNGLHALARHVASRWGTEGIRANVVAPGLVLTEAVKEHLTQEFVDDAKMRIPHRRLGKPDDIAAMVAMLASDDGEWINGQVISVNGGAAYRD